MLRNTEIETTHLESALIMMQSVHQTYEMIFSNNRSTSNHDFNFEARVLKQSVMC